jgi:hypothetical protein
MRLKENVTRMGKIRNAYRIIDGKPERKRYLGDLDVDESIISKWVLKTVTNWT